MIDVLHIANDQKFIDSGLRSFNSLHGVKNTLHVITDIEECTYVKSKHEKISLNEYKGIKYLEKVNKYKYIVLHSLFVEHLNFAKDAKIIWIGWGYDYYTRFWNVDDFLLPVTLDIYRKNSPLKSLNKLIKIAKNLKLLYMKYKFKKLIHRINYFSPVLESEYALVKNRIKCNDNFPKPFRFNYGTLEDDYLKLFHCNDITGNNILIGNSSDVYNNHFDIIELLLKGNITKRKCIFPLSYGSKKYASEIKDVLQKSSLMFEMLDDFICIDDYVDYLSSCSTMIFNHIRQQALGNIIIGLFLGSSIFLRKENPIYSFLKDKGFYIFSVEDLESKDISLDVILKKEQVDINKSLLKSIWARNIINGTLEKSFYNMVEDEL